jgi:molecular chaperone GrpE
LSIEQERFWTMSNAKPQTEKAEPTATAEAAEPQQVSEEVPAETPDPEAPGTPAPAEERIAELEGEVATLKDQLLRALAETENVRRRGERERADSVKYAAVPILRDLLAVADNLNRAVESAAADDTAGDPRLETLLTGVKLTEKELATVLERHHVVKLDPIGERLDPHRHEAMFEVPDESRPSGTVVQVIQHGYMLHDRLLRPARVGVSGGGPAKAPSAGQEGEPEDAGEQSPEPTGSSGPIDTSA